MTVSHETMMKKLTPHRTRVEPLLLEGLESGEEMRGTPEFWRHLNEEAAALLKKQMQKPKPRREK